MYIFIDHFSSINKPLSSCKPGKKCGTKKDEFDCLICVNTFNSENNYTALLECKITIIV
jgi:hypothetical protein